MKPRPVFLVAILAAYTLLHVHPLTSAETKSKSSTQPKPTGQQTAAQLLADAKKALAYTVKAARADGQELSATNPDAKPFLLALQKVSKSLDDAQKSLAAKDPEFFKAIGHADSGVSQMQATWDLTKSNNADVIKGGRALSGAVDALHSEYGPMAERKIKGGALTDSEKQNFTKIKSAQPTFRKELGRLYAQSKKEPALELGLRKLSKRSMEIEKAPDTVAGYAGAMDLMSSLSGLLHGYSYYAPPSKRKSWGALTKSTSSWSSYAYSSDSGYNWSYTETPVDVYDSYDTDISDEEVTAEENFVEETSFEMTEQEETEVAEESDEIPQEEVNDNEMESEQESVDESEDTSDMGAEDEGDEASSDEMGDDGGGDDGGGDDGGGDDGGGDE